MAKSTIEELAHYYVTAHEEWGRVRDQITVAATLLETHLWQAFGCDASARLPVEGKITRDGEYVGKAALRLATNVPPITVPFAIRAEKTGPVLEVSGEAAPAPLEAAALPTAAELFARAFRKRIDDRAARR